MYYCGLDGGGTKTALCAMNEDGHVIGDAAFGPMNLNGSSAETVEATIRDAVTFMARQLPGGLDACIGLVVGMAGISNSTSVCFVESAIRKAGYQGSLHLAGDQEIALNGAINGPGAVLIAGTGSVCCGRDGQGKMYRTGGYGYLIDDIGSGYAIGHDILQAVVRAHDGRGPVTELTDAVYEQLAIASVSQLVTWLYSSTTGKKEIAALAPLLIKAYQDGDEASRRIADDASDGLAKLVIALWQNAGLTNGELALTGGILRHYPMISTGVKERVLSERPDILIHAPYHDPAYGAAMMALSGRS